MCGLGSSLRDSGGLRPLRFRLWLAGKRGFSDARSFLPYGLEAVLVVRLHWHQRALALGGADDSGGTGAAVDQVFSVKRQTD